MGLFDKFKEKREASALRVGFILLETPELDWEALCGHLQNDWDIAVTERPEADGPLMFEHEGMQVAAMFVPAPHTRAGSRKQRQKQFPVARRPGSRGPAPSPGYSHGLAGHK